MVDQESDKSPEQKVGFGLKVLNILAIFVSVVGGVSDWPDKLGVPKDFVVWAILAAIVLTISSVLSLVFEKIKFKRFVLASVSFSLVIGFLIVIGADAFGKKFHPDAQIHIPESKHQLTVRGVDAYLVRTQFFDTRREISAFYETDFWTDGNRIDTSQFQSVVQETSKDRTQVCKTHYSIVTKEWLPGPRQLRTQINPYLGNGKYFERSLIWTSIGAFTDSVGDYFTVNINDPTDQEIIDVKLENGREIDTSNVVFDLVKRMGVVNYGEAPPGTITRGPVELSWTIPHPEVGDRFHIRWLYLRRGAAPAPTD